MMTNQQIWGKWIDMLLRYPQESIKKPSWVCHIGCASVVPMLFLSNTRLVLEEKNQYHNSKKIY